MKTAAVIAEYNPFHKGHAWQLSQLRQRGASHIAVVMSPDFTQRGTPAILPKRVRAAAALQGGADLVLELPVCYALLEQAANALEHPQVQLALKEELAAGITFAKARERAVGRVFGERVSQILQQPNNILAVEYLAQLRGLSPERRPQAIPLERVGNAHDGAPVQGFASASYLRGLLLAGEWEQAAEYLPDFALHLYRQAAKEGKLARMENGERAVLSALRRMSREELAVLPDISEGIENRLYAAAQKACSLEELYEQVKTKRYPLSRVRRLVLAAFLQIPAQAHQTPPPYLRVLGMNERGREILSRMKRTASLPVSVSLSRLAQSSPEAAALAALEAACADQYGLFTERIFPCGLDYSEPVVKG